MRKWTDEERSRQAELIRGWRPWKKAGVKTPEGKAISSKNALKHGLYGEEVREMRSIMALSLRNLKTVKAVLASQGEMDDASLQTAFAAIASATAKIAELSEKRETN